MNGVSVSTTGSFGNPGMSGRSNSTIQPVSVSTTGSFGNPAFLQQAEEQLDNLFQYPLLDRSVIRG